MKKLLSAAAAIVLAASLGACSSDSKSSKDSSSSGGDYCSLLKDAKGGFGSLSADQLSEDSFSKTRDQIQSLQDSATGSIADDWGTLGGALDDLKAAVDKAGMSLSDVPALITGKVPDGVTPTEAQEVVAALQKMGSDPAVATAANEIQADATKTCKVDLGSSTPSN